MIALCVKTASQKNWGKASVICVYWPQEYHLVVPEVNLAKESITTLSFVVCLISVNVLWMNYSMMYTHVKN